MLHTRTQRFQNVSRLLSNPTAPIHLHSHPSHQQQLYRQVPVPVTSLRPSLYRAKLRRSMEPSASSSLSVLGSGLRPNTVNQHYQRLYHHPYYLPQRPPLASHLSMKQEFSARLSFQRQYPHPSLHRSFPYSSQANRRPTEYRPFRQFITPLPASRPYGYAYPGSNEFTPRRRPAMQSSFLHRLPAFNFGRSAPQQMQQPRSLLQLNLTRQIATSAPQKIISNMPLIGTANESMIIINNSPFALTDRRFGILHHCARSDSYV